MAKEILYGIDARNALCRGIDKLANTVKMTSHNTVNLFVAEFIKMLSSSQHMSLIHTDMDLSGRKALGES